MRACLAIGLGLVLAAGCANKGSRDLGPEPPPITGEWTDDFERSKLGSDWLPTSGAYQLVNGGLSAKGAYNRPLWLRKKLPRNAVIELDVWSKSPSGDIKVELYGDGKSYDPDKGSYLATSYVAVMGGWSNSKSIIARKDEHGTAIAERKLPVVEVDKRYHWKFVRDGNTLTWYVDDMSTPFLTFEDPEPLAGEGHQYFAINNWESDAWFDNIRIAPLSESDTESDTESESDTDPVDGKQ